MSTIEQKLAEFVDRTAEMQLFLEQLESGDPPVLVVTAEEGFGKSTLMARMAHECALRQLRKSEVVWGSGRNHDYLFVMRKMRDDFGVAPFSEFTELVNAYGQTDIALKVTVEGSVSVAENARFQDTTTGDIAGVLIKDSFFSIPREDLAAREAEKRMRLTDSFVANLAEALRPTGQPFVVFFDEVDEMSDETSQWIWGELLRAVSDGRLTNIRFVLCGREKPPDDLDRDVSRIIEETALRPLEFEHVVEYLKKRGFEDESNTLATMLMGNSQGRPREIATMLDGFERYKKKMERGRG